MKKTLAAFLLMLAAPLAQAGTYQGRIFQLYLVNDGIAILMTANPLTNATCPYNNRFVFDVTTTIGKARLKMALAVYQAGGSLYVQGDGTCHPTHGGEGIYYFNTTPNTTP